ncbi:MAG: zinc-dependent metalloprotease [Candidatus Eremiobacteraeota bacterium]|nr:zinc-dependent metalloprotease [Candidatus Eremiobacteraeota bacterium]
MVLFRVILSSLMAVGSFAFPLVARPQTPPSPAPSTSPVPTPKPPEPTPHASPNVAAPALTSNPIGSNFGNKEDLMPYDKFTEGAERQDGLFTIWLSKDKVYFELTPDQFNKDFIENAVPANGLGGYFVLSGEVFVQEARIFRFDREGRRVTLLWPSTRFLADPNTPLSEAIEGSTAASVIGEAPVVSENPKTHALVVDMSALLGDVMNATDYINGSVALENDPESQYHLDPSRTHFGQTKAFPQNVIVEVQQTYASTKPKVIDTVEDPRSVQLRVKYNIAELQASPDYIPRLYDDRVGFFEDAHVDFTHETRWDPYEHFVTRWNMKASDPSKPLSPATHPMVFTLSNTIPVEYRQPIRDAILTWNNAFERIGISDAVQVKDQPNDPSFDPDDIRYNVVRWLTESNANGFAEAQILWNPRTGEVFHTGILLDHDLVSYGKYEYEDETGAVTKRARNTFALAEARGTAQLHREFLLGRVAYNVMYGGDPPKAYIDDFLKAVVLHETGHDFGLQHNFIGHMAYTSAQLRDRAFTGRYGVASSVMEYAPLNLWPKRMGQGHYWQTVLGPYDYYAIHWGYAPVPGANTTRAEVPTLNRWASRWSEPWYRFASDEDVDWQSGHAVDPRVEHFMLTNDPIAWCSTRMQMFRGLMNTVDRRFPRTEEPYESERESFATLLGSYSYCASTMAHYIGGEALSRARRGDPHAPLPLTPISRSEESRAFATLDTYLFSDRAWSFSPETLRKLVYAEHSGFVNFGYEPAPRHDISVAEQALRYQTIALTYMFAPLTLQRIADLPTKSQAGETISLSDLFTWSQRSIYGDVGRATTTSQIRRNLQRRYAGVLSNLVLSPARGTPYDAQSFARYELSELSDRLGKALRLRNLDLQTRVHYEALRSDVQRALQARSVIPTS